MITETLSNEHAHCDNLFAQAESDVANGQWEKAARGVADFVKAMGQHFSAEEQILFPAFEQRTGQTAGPTQVMRFEHQQMRQLFAQMQQGLAQQDSSEYLGISETLLMLMRQHNAKEEQILYPMSDRVLGNEASAILAQMEQSKQGV